MKAKVSMSFGIGSNEYLIQMISNEITKIGLLISVSLITLKSEDVIRVAKWLLKII